MKTRKRFFLTIESFLTDRCRVTLKGGTNLWVALWEGWNSSADLKAIKRNAPCISAVFGPVFASSTTKWLFVNFVANYPQEAQVVYHLEKISGENSGWFVPLENLREQRDVWKGSPVFPLGTFRWKRCSIYKFWKVLPVPGYSWPYF